MLKSRFGFMHLIGRSLTIGLICILIIIIIIEKIQRVNLETITNECVGLVYKGE